MRFLRAFLGSVAVIALLYLLVLNLVNPRDEFAGHTFPPVFLDVRREKMAQFMAFDRDRPVEGLIIGSSRSMTLPPERLDSATGLRSFNFAVHAGTVEDYLALFRWVRSRDPALKVVILGLDPWSLEPGPPAEFFQDNWDLVAALHPDRATLPKKLLHYGGVYHRAFTLGYANDIVKSVRLRVHPLIPIQVLHPDGGMHYERWNREIAAGTFPRDSIIGSCVAQEVGAAADEGGAIPAHGPAGEPASQDREAMVESIFREAAADSIQIVAWITPSHPRLLEALQRRPGSEKALIRTRTTAARLAARYGGTLLDLSSVDAYHGDPNGWYDCSHFGIDDSKRIADTLSRMIRQAHRDAGAPGGI